MNEIALQAGRKFVRPETGWVHYYYHGHSNESHATIPVYENFNWILTLFQTKTLEGIQEAKKLLEKLLAFQNKEGEFPVYLHEYPQATDLFLGAYLFQPLYWIYKDFGNILGSELNKKVSLCLTDLIEALQKRYREKEPQGHLSVKVGAAIYAWTGEDEILKGAKSEFVSSSHLADLELAKDLGAPHLPSWPSLYWHAGLQTYLGPSFRELQEGLEPEVTLLDLMMGTQRSVKLSPRHLAAALIRSSPVLSHETHQRGIRQGDKWGYSALEMEKELPYCHQPGFHLFRYLSLSRSGCLETLAIPASRVSRAAYKETLQGIKFQFGLSAPFEGESKDTQREIELFVNRGPKISCSLFRLNEPLEILFDTTKLRLTFRLTAGEGDFIGHLSRGNRPAQRAKDEAYDQVLSLRTLRRSSEVEIELEIELV